MNKISLFTKFTILLGQITLEELLNRFLTGFYAYLIIPLRQMYKDGNLKGYDLGKRGLDAATFSATFNKYRRMEYCDGYTGYMVLDIDKLTEVALPIVRDLIIHCEYTLSCFLSPSGYGLKVLVRVSTGPEDHLSTFKSLVHYYEVLTGVVIDKSGSDITRLSFITYDPHLFYNRNATVFNPTKGAGQTWPEVVPEKPVLTGNQKIVNKIGKNEGKPRKKSPGQKSSNLRIIYNRCVELTQRNHTFIEGQRNVFVFNLALFLKNAGQPEDVTSILIKQDYNFDEREVSNCIRSAYRYVWPDDANGADGNSISHMLETSVDQKEFQSEVDGNQNPSDLYLPGNNQDNEEAGNGNQIPSDHHSEDYPFENESNDQRDNADLPAPIPPSVPPQKEKKQGRLQYLLKAVEQLLLSFIVTRYNEVKGMIEWRKSGSSKPFKRLDDHDENSIFRWLHHMGQLIPINTLHALLNSSFSPVFNPFKSYFQHLRKWDRKTDYIGQLAATVKTKDNKYWAFCFKKWFVAYAASLIDDDVINHTVIVFVGPQGVGKTSWLRLLLPKGLKEYFGIAALHTDNKDTAIQLAECALIVIDEFESLNRKDLAILKEIVTRAEISVRRPYGHNSEILRRRASFAAAVNHDKVLTDLTGSRRYLCVVVESIDYKHTVNIDRCMAQAYALYKSGFQFWFDKEQISVLTDRNEDFMAKSVVEELIMLWLRKVTRAEWNDRFKFANSQAYKSMSATQIATLLIEKAKFNLTDNITVQIGKIMNKMAFDYVKKSNVHYYLVRIIDGDVVERESRLLDETEAKKKAQEDNEQILRHEEDLMNSSGNDELPF